MKLIYITGIDGCGKTTQSKLLVEYLNARLVKTQYQWLRWSPSIGRVISLFRGSHSKNLTAHVINDSDIKSGENKSFNRWSKFKKILFSIWLFRMLWLKYSTRDYYQSYKRASSEWSGDVIVLDRYYFDFIVDQSINFNESAEIFDRKVKSGILRNLKQPDIFILIDITPEVGWERKRDGTSMDHLKKLSIIYDSAKHNDSVYVIDGSYSEQIVHDEIIKIVSKYFIV